MRETDILAFVVSTDVLDEYRTEDTCLDMLINKASESPGIWQTRIDIDVTSPHSLPALHFEQIARRRLAGIPHRPETESLRAATEQLIEYCVAHPTAAIWGVTFNCPEHSFHVRCGQVDQRMDVICVTVGKHIPEYAMRQR